MVTVVGGCRECHQSSVEGDGEWVWKGAGGGVAPHLGWQRCARAIEQRTSPTAVIMDDALLDTGAFNDRLEPVVCAVGADEARVPCRPSGAAGRPAACSTHAHRALSPRPLWRGDRLFGRWWHPVMMRMTIEC
eukprot:ctg_1058.g379